MIVDAENLTFWVPDDGPGDKLQLFLTEARTLLAAPRPTPRALARVAGQLLSFTPAVDLAPLLARSLYHILRGHVSRGWDLGFDSDRALVEALQWCVEAVPRWNGSRMLKRDPAMQLQLAGDASEVRAAPYKQPDC